MITILIERQNEQIIAFTVSGHAKSGPYGFDLVCAGVSAITFGSVNAIHQLCQIDLLIEQQDEGGYLNVALPEKVSHEKLDQAQLLLEGMIVSLKTIEREYNKFISIEDT